MTGFVSAIGVSSIVRFAAICAFAFWQGGFVFYAGVVVPIGSDELGDTLQGFITRRVTQGLNIAGVVALIILLADGLRNFQGLKTRGWFWAFWILMVLCQAWLIVQHPAMDRLLEPETVSILDRKRFRLQHQIYLWTSTVMWVASLGWAWLLATGTRQAEVNEKPRT